MEKGVKKNAAGCEKTYKVFSPELVEGRFEKVSAIHRPYRVELLAAVYAAAGGFIFQKALLNDRQFGCCQFGSSF